MTIPAEESGGLSARQGFLWLWFLTLAVWPRVCILAFWIFGVLLGDTYDHWIVPVIGFVIAPSTTLAYALMWGLSSHGVHGWEWVFVAFGVLLDLWMWGAWQRIRAGD
jgi:hypothetical protein